MIKHIKDWLGIETKGQLSHPSPELLALFAAVATESGESVNPENALRCAVWYSSVKVLSESIAQLPLILYRRTPDGGKERATDHPLYSILHDQVNDWTSSFEFRSFMQGQLCGHGNALAYINRTGGRVQELIPLPWRSVQVDVDETTMEPSYTVTIADQQRTYDRTHVLHLRTLGTDPHIGLSPVSQAREAIALSIAMEGYAARLFGRGGRPSGVLKLPGKLNDKEAIKRLRESFSKVYGGKESAGTAILEHGVDFEPLQFSSVDAQFLEMRRHQIAEICRVLRIPLHMVQELERTTHNNAEHMGRQFVSLTLMPWTVLWQQAMQRSLLTPAERSEYVIEFMFDDLVRADIAARFEAYAKGITNGVLNPNEVRSLENRPPYAGGGEFRLPMNTEVPGQTQEPADV